MIRLVPGHASWPAGEQPPSPSHPVSEEVVRAWERGEARRWCCQNCKTEQEYDWRTPTAPQNREDAGDAGISERGTPGASQAAADGGRWRVVAQKALAERHGYEFVDLRQMPVDPAVRDLLLGFVARELAVFPFALRGDAVRVAVTDPLAVRTIDELEYALGRPVEPVIASEDSLETMIREHYGPEGSDRALEVFNELNRLCDPRDIQTLCAPFRKDANYRYLEYLLTIGETVPMKAARLNVARMGPLVVEAFALLAWYVAVPCREAPCLSRRWRMLVFNEFAQEMRGTRLEWDEILLKLFSGEGRFRELSLLCYVHDAWVPTACCSICCRCGHERFIQKDTLVPRGFCERCGYGPSVLVPTDDRERFEEVQRLEARARESLGKGDGGDAIDLLRLATALQADHPMVLLGLGTCLCAEGRRSGDAQKVEEAALWLERAAKLYPSFVAARAGLNTVCEALAEMRGGQVRLPPLVDTSPRIAAAAALKAEPPPEADTPCSWCGNKAEILVYADGNAVWGCRRCRVPLQYDVGRRHGRNLSPEMRRFLLGIG